MSTRVVDVNSIKVGSYVVIDNEPCKVVSVEHSKGGKHGHAKARIVAIGLFTNSKRSIVLPTSEKIEIPIIEKANCQILSKEGEHYLVMDLTTYEQFAAEGPEDENIKAKLDEALERGEVPEGEVWKVMGKAMIVKLSRSTE